MSMSNPQAQARGRDDYKFKLHTSHAKELVVSTYAGSTTGHKDGDREVAQFNFPCGIVYNPNDRCLYVSEQINHTIRKITPGGLVTTFAGKPGQPGYVDGAGTEAQFKNPNGMAIYFKENVLYVADHDNQMIRKITASGMVSSYAGTQISGGAHRDGPAGQAAFNGPFSLAVDQRNGDVYVSEFSGQYIRKITQSNGRIFAHQVDSGGVTINQVRIKLPEIEILPAHLWLDVISWCDQRTLAILSQTCSALYHPAQQYIGGHVTTIAGDGTYGTKEGIASNSSFYSPCGLCFSEEEDILYISDHNNGKIKKLDMKTKVVSTIAGAGLGWADGEDTEARFNQPHGTALIRSDKSLLVADWSGNRIRLIKQGKPTIVTTFAGTGAFGGKDGNALECTILGPSSICIDCDKNVIYFVDQNQKVRMLSSP